MLTLAIKSRFGRPFNADTWPLMGQKKLNLRPLLTHQFPLSRFQEALRIALHHPRHQSVKVALKPAQG